MGDFSPHMIVVLDAPTGIRQGLIDQIRPTEISIFSGPIITNTFMYYFTGPPRFVR